MRTACIVRTVHGRIYANMNKLKSTDWKVQLKYYLTAQASFVDASFAVFVTVTGAIDRHTLLDSLADTVEPTVFRQTTVVNISIRTFHFKSNLLISFSRLKFIMYEYHYHIPFHQSHLHNLQNHHKPIGSRCILCHIGSHFCIPNYSFNGEKKM